MKRYQEEYLMEVKYKLLIHKWLESEKAGRDLGQESVKDWIKKFAKTHRAEFIGKKLIQAENDLNTLKEDKNIPRSVINLLEQIYDCILSVKTNIEIDTPKIPENL